MLEDIRTHSPVPTHQEVEWMAARPARAVLCVGLLGFLAFTIVTFALDRGASLEGATLAAVAPPATGGGR